MTIADARRQPHRYEDRRDEHKMKLHEAFNRTAFSKFLNRPAGRIFRAAAGTGILIVGLLFRQKRAERWLQAAGGAVALTLVWTLTR